ncbi:MAG: isoaspartyl peptidase/L-asparaginase [Nitrospirae bacterium]|nr:isoaspartyl peptidase/L-asparaginase [Nitrospirota bacterium]
MILIVHGGAGDKRPTKNAIRKISESLSCGYEMLNRGGTAVDAVAKSIKILEDSGIFNAGTGGNIQLDGVRRLDASIMDGKSLKAGAAIGLEGIKNPIEAAGIIMNLPHVMLTNIGAKKIAVANSLEPLPEPDEKLLERFKRIPKKEINMHLKNMSPFRAAQLSLIRLRRIGGEGGVIVLNKKGRFAILHTTKFMASGCIDKKGIVVKELWSDKTR